MQRGETIPTDVHVKAAKAICRSGKFETGQGTCTLLCMQFLGDPRKNGCPNALRIHGKLALDVLDCWPATTTQGGE